MIKNGESSSMPKFFAKFPFWVWPLIGLICLMLSVPGFIAGQEKKVRQAALASAAPELIDLEDFDRQAHTGLANEVNIFAQTNSNYHFLIDGAGISAGGAYVVPLFSAMAGPKEKSVSHVLLVANLADLEDWLAENKAGTARMGELFQINGEIIDGRGFTAAIRVTLRDAGLTQVDPLVIVKPFIAGRTASLSAPTRATFGNPFILSASGAWMIWFGFVVWSRSKKLKLNVGRRMGELGERASSENGVNLSRLKRKSQKLVSANSEAPPVKAIATPAE